MNLQNERSTEILLELQARLKARLSFRDYVAYVEPQFHWSQFAETVCASVESFINDVFAGKLPVLILQAPPQHGKSTLVSKLLPAYLMCRYPELNLLGTSYNYDYAKKISKDVKQYVHGLRSQNVFPYDKTINREGFYILKHISNFSSPNSVTGGGGYYGAGSGGAITGRRVDIAIIDDPIKNSADALSETKSDSLWEWFQSTLLTRMSLNSGIILMATCWGQLDLLSRVADAYKDSPKLTHLKFPALNYPEEAGYTPDLPEGALVPQLHSEKQLREIKALQSAFWYSAMYQQTPIPAGGLIFRAEDIQFYRFAELPKRFPVIIHSWDLTFKEVKDSDFVVGQVWGKIDTKNYLLAQVRERMGFTKTCEAIKMLWDMFPRGKVLIEDKANGSAVIDSLRKIIPNITPITPTESKEARAHAITPVFESKNVYLPYPDENLWVKDFVARHLMFPSGAHDDETDAMTQALTVLNPYFGKLNINPDYIQKLKERQTQMRLHYGT